MISADEARSLLSYSLVTGMFKRKVITSGRVQVGDFAGAPHGNGYLKIGLFGKQYFAHRLAWLIVMGEWPEEQIDHINGDRADNRWINLRKASNQENMRNASMPNTNTSGVIGVHWDKRRAKWLAQIKVDGEPIHLGRFADLSAAASARKAAEQKYGFHPNHGRI